MLNLVNELVKEELKVDLDDIGLSQIQYGGNSCHTNLLLNH